MQDEKFILTTIGLLGTTSQVFAEDSLVSFYGNTMHVYPKDGPVHRIHYNADGTYQGIYPDRRVTGTYKIVNGEVCNTFTGAESKAATICHAFDFTKKVGDSWTLNDRGRMISFKLETGQI